MGQPGGAGPRWGGPSGGLPLLLCRRAQCEGVHAHPGHPAQGELRPSFHRDPPPESPLPQTQHLPVPPLPGVNCYNLYDAAVPFGGYKVGGVGVGSEWAFCPAAVGRLRGALARPPAHPSTHPPARTQRTLAWDARRASTLYLTTPRWGEWGKMPAWGEWGEMPAPAKWGARGARVDGAGAQNRPPRPHAPQGMQQQPPKLAQHPPLPQVKAVYQPLDSPAWR